MTEQAPALVADVGGTNTRCALARGGGVLTHSVRRHANAEFAARGEGLGHVLTAYLAAMEDAGELSGAPGRLSGAAVAIAGPVRDGAGRLTNIDWRMDRTELARIAGTARVEVLNDLQAQGQALDDLAPGSLRQVLAGQPAPAGATRMVVGAGTGFNAAPVLETAAGRLVPPSEAGHVSAPARGPEEQRLMRFIEREVAGAEGFASVEDVLAGRGLETIYLWLGHEAGAPVPAPSRRIVAAAAEGSDPRAEAAVRVYVGLLGNVVGNLALTLLPYGGIYLIGGMARAVQPWLEAFGFAQALCDKGRLREFMAQFPVFVVENDFAALTGCAVHLQRGT